MAHVVYMAGQDWILRHQDYSNLTLEVRIFGEGAAPPSDTFADLNDSDTDTTDFNLTTLLSAASNPNEYAAFGTGGYGSAGPPAIPPAITFAATAAEVVSAVLRLKFQDVTLTNLAPSGNTGPFSLVVVTAYRTAIGAGSVTDADRVPIVAFDFDGTGGNPQPVVGQNADYTLAMPATGLLTYTQA